MLVCNYPPLNLDRLTTPEALDDLIGGDAQKYRLDFDKDRVRVACLIAMVRCS